MFFLVKSRHYMVFESTPIHYHYCIPDYTQWTGKEKTFTVKKKTDKENAEREGVMKGLTFHPSG